MNLKHVILMLSILIFSNNVFSQSTTKNPKVDFDSFLELAKKVQVYRKSHLLNLEDFKKYSNEKGSVILDTRSKELFDQKHIKGAIHLNFSDFTQTNLYKLIPDNKTRILIYCNNNFENDEVNFATKSYVPPRSTAQKKPITLALNIPTFINLIGYGFENVYELNDLINVNSNKIEFEGTEVFNLNPRIENQLQK
ncbi:MAG: rhodanese-like domain-containing protein [Chitinophagaceae bacterium]|nr:rhodanese-like domain-containing protein [Chitinophagaceae bacterium]